jgi:carbon storage regulator
VLIGGGITITVLEIRANSVRLGIEAPIETTVHREEVALAIQQELDGRPDED